MSQIKISQLPAAGGLNNSDELPIVQNGATKRTTVGDVAALANPYPFTPEDVANKVQSVGENPTSTTKYPSTKAVKDYADGLVVGLLSDQGNWSAAGGQFPDTRPGGGAIQKGDLWYISVNGTLGGTSVLVGYSIRALVANPGQTAANWGILNAGLGFIPENSAYKSDDGTFAGPNSTDYPTTQAVKTYVDANSSNSTLQSVTASSKRGLNQGLNFQGTNAGPSITSTKNDINAFGASAAAGYTGTGQCNVNALGNSAASSSSGLNVNAMGQLAASGNDGDNVNAFGYDAATDNDVDADNVNALGSSAAKNNQGSNVNAFGFNAGLNNTYNNVNLFGESASAVGENQTVFSKNASDQAIISFADVTGLKTFTLPNANGTLALTTNIPSTPSLAQVTTVGAVTTTNITASGALGTSIKAANASSNAAAELTTGGSNSNGVLKLTRTSGQSQLLAPNAAAGGQEIILPPIAGTLALDENVSLVKIAGTPLNSKRDLNTDGNLLMGTGSGGTGVGAGTQKIHIGTDAGKGNTASSNITLGQSSGAYTASGATVTYGANNIAIGPSALSTAATSGSVNMGAGVIAIGNSAGINSSGASTSTNKIYIGTEAGKLNNAGNNVIAIGASAGANDSSISNVNFGSDNVFIGTQAGRLDNSSSLTTTGSKNVFIGTLAGYNTGSSNSIVIGANAGGPQSYNGCTILGANVSNIENKIVLGNNNYNSTWRQLQIDVSSINGTRAVISPTQDGTLLVTNTGVNVFTRVLTASNLASPGTIAATLLPALTTGIYVFKSVSVAFNVTGGTLHTTTGRTLNITYSDGTPIASFPNFGTSTGTGFFQSITASVPPVAATEATTKRNNSINIVLTAPVTGGTTGYNVTVEYYIVPVPAP